MGDDDASYSREQTSAGHAHGSANSGSQRALVGSLSGPLGVNLSSRAHGSQPLSSRAHGSQPLRHVVSGSSGAGPSRPSAPRTSTNSGPPHVPPPISNPPILPQAAPSSSVDKTFSDGTDSGFDSMKVDFKPSKVSNLVVSFEKELSDGNAVKHNDSTPPSRTASALPGQGFSHRPSMRNAHGRASIARDLKRGAELEEMLTSSRRGGLRKVIDLILQPLKFFLLKAGKVGDEYWIQTGQANIFFTGVIFFNSIFIGVEVDWRKRNPHESWSAVESLFLSIFTLELLLRLQAEKMLTFKDRWNCFDAFLVVSGIIDTWLMQLWQVNAEGSKFTAFRLLRMLRMLRILRLFRFSHNLQLLADGILGAVKALVWALCFITVILYMCAIFVTQLWGKKANELEDPEAREQMSDWFGSVSRSLMTLFQLMTLEDWPGVATVCMDEYPLLWIFLIPFVCFTNYTLLNLVTAVVVENVLGISQKEQGDVARQEDLRRVENVRLLKQLFDAMDEDGNGELDHEEFFNAIHDPDVKMQFAQLEISGNDASELFDLLDLDKDGSITVDEFVEGCLRVRGSCKAKHLLALQYDLHSCWNDTSEGMFGMQGMLDMFRNQLGPRLDQLPVGGLQPLERGSFDSSNAAQDSEKAQAASNGKSDDACLEELEKVVNSLLRSASPAEPKQPQGSSVQHPNMAGVLQTPSPQSKQPQSSSGKSLLCPKPGVGLQRRTSGNRTKLFIDTEMIEAEHSEGDAPQRKASKRSNQSLLQVSNDEDVEIPLAKTPSMRSNLSARSNVDRPMGSGLLLGKKIQNKAKLSKEADNQRKLSNVSNRSNNQLVDRIPVQKITSQAEVLSSFDQQPAVTKTLSNASSARSSSKESNRQHGSKDSTEGLTARRQHGSKDSTKEKEKGTSSPSEKAQNTLASAGSTLSSPSGDQSKGGKFGLSKLAKPDVPIWNRRRSQSVAATSLAELTQKHMLQNDETLPRDTPMSPGPGGPMKGPAMGRKMSMAQFGSGMPSGDSKARGLGFGKKLVSRGQARSSVGGSPKDSGEQVDLTPLTDLNEWTNTANEKVEELVDTLSSCKLEVDELKEDFREHEEKFEDAISRIQVLKQLILDKTSPVTK